MKQKKVSKDNVELILLDLINMIELGSAKRQEMKERLNAILRDKAVVKKD